MDDETLHGRLTALADHLTATAERPVETTASRWLGEAEAVSRDLADGAAERSVVRERLAHVDHLLGEVEETGDETADEHVDAARETVAAIRAALDE